MKNYCDVIVIGAGASGLMAAIAAAREGASVTVLERMKKGGRKLLVTGNGRCNLTSLDPDLLSRYHSQAPEAMREMTASVFSAFSVKDTMDFFMEEGLLLRERGEYVYPACGQASAVLETLLEAAERAHVTVRYNTKAESVSGPDPEGIMTVFTDGWKYSAGSVVISTGSYAWYNEKERPDGYRLAGETGHRIIPVLPALTALCSPDPGLAQAAGARSDATVTLHIETGRQEERTYTERGELQWTKDALSGIAVFQLSGFAARALYEKRKVRLEIDLVPDLPEQELAAFLTEQIRKRCGPGSGPGADISPVLNGLLHSRVVEMLLRRWHLSGVPAEKISAARIDRMARDLKRCIFMIHDVRDYSQAQTCCGGIDLTEINPQSLSSRHRSGLYFSGEILDIDGPCGGYNLQWAWSSGTAAGREAARYSLRRIKGLKTR